MLTHTKFLSCSHPLSSWFPNLPLESSGILIFLKEESVLITLDFENACNLLYYMYGLGQMNPFCHLFTVADSLTDLCLVNLSLFFQEII